MVGWPEIELARGGDLSHGIQYQKLIDYRALNLERELDRRLLRECLDDFLLQLGFDRGRVLRLLFGFDGPELSTHEIARVLECRRERVVCLRCIALTLLHRRFGARLQPYVEALLE